MRMPGSAAAVPSSLTVRSYGAARRVPCEVPRDRARPAGRAGASSSGRRSGRLWTATRLWTTTAVMSVRAPTVPDMAPAALSPSRAADFMQCPLLYRFRVVDRLPEAPSPAAVRGTVVHAVLERLFELTPERRTLASAAGLVAGQWDRVRAEDPELGALFDGDAEAVAG